MLRVKEITKKYETAKNTMREILVQNHKKQLKSGQSQQNRAISQVAKISQPAKFCNYENSQLYKISTMLTLPLYIAVIAFCFVYATSSSARVLRI